MSILRAALLASSSTIPCRPAGPHLYNATNHPLRFIPNVQHFRICVSSFCFSTTCALRHRIEAPSFAPHWSQSGERERSAVWTRVTSPVISLIRSTVSREGFSGRAGGSHIRRLAGENSSSLCLVDLSDHQQRPYATGGRNPQSAAAGASSFSAVGGRRTMRSRGNADSNGESKSSRHTSSPKRVGAFAEDVENEGRVGAPLTDLEKDKFKEVEIKQTNKLLTLPTILTLARVAAVPAILAVFYSNEPWAASTAAVIFVIAAVTDWLDGYLARKMGTSSAFGAFLDPVADKLMVAAALVLLCTKPLANADLAAIPWLLPIPTIAIIGREITMSAVREWAASQGGDLHKAVAVNNLGKIKTASQMVAITLLLASGEGGVDTGLTGVVGVGLLYVAAFLALLSLGKYMRGIWGSMFK